MMERIQQRYFCLGRSISLLFFFIGLSIHSQSFANNPDVTFKEGVTIYHFESQLKQDTVFSLPDQTRPIIHAKTDVYIVGKQEVCGLENLKNTNLHRIEASSHKIKIDDKLAGNIIKHKSIKDRSKRYTEIILQDPYTGNPWTIFNGNTEFCLLSSVPSTLKLYILFEAGTLSFTKELYQIVSHYCYRPDAPSDTSVFHCSRPPPSLIGAVI